MQRALPTAVASGEGYLEDLRDACELGTRVAKMPDTAEVLRLRDALGAIADRLVALPTAEAELPPFGRPRRRRTPPPPRPGPTLQALMALKPAVDRATHDRAPPALTFIGSILHSLAVVRARLSGRPRPEIDPRIRAAARKDPSFLGEAWVRLLEQTSLDNLERHLRALGPLTWAAAPEDRPRAPTAAEVAASEVRSFYEQLCSRAVQVGYVAAAFGPSVALHFPRQAVNQEQRKPQGARLAAAIAQRERQQHPALRAPIQKTRASFGLLPVGADGRAELDALKARFDLLLEAEPAVPFAESDFGVETTYRTHTVQAGDNLRRIAEAELGDAERFEEIADLNGITPPYAIAPGQELKVEALSSPLDAPDADFSSNLPDGASLHRVQPGQSLLDIAYEYQRRRYARPDLDLLGVAEMILAYNGPDADREGEVVPLVLEDLNSPLVEDTTLRMPPADTAETFTRPNPLVRAYSGAFFVVKEPGMTTASIAARYRLSPERVAEALGDVEALPTGTRMLIPPMRPSRGPIEYDLPPGTSIEDVAEFFGYGAGAIPALMRANPRARYAGRPISRVLLPEQQQEFRMTAEAYQVPIPTEVVSEDTARALLSRWAEAHGVTVEALLSENGIEDDLLPLADRLASLQGVLRIPTLTEAEPTPTPWEQLPVVETVPIDEKVPPWLVALERGIDFQVLMAVNRVYHPQELVDLTELRIPELSEATRAQPFDVHQALALHEHVEQVIRQDLEAERWATAVWFYETWYRDEVVTRISAAPISEDQRNDRIDYQTTARALMQDSLSHLEHLIAVHMIRSGVAYVRQGDTLSGIAEWYNAHVGQTGRIAYPDIQLASRMGTSTLLRPETYIKVPARPTLPEPSALELPPPRRPPLEEEHGR